MFRKFLTNKFPMEITITFATDRISSKMLLGGKDLMELITSIEFKIIRGQKETYKKSEDFKIILQIFNPIKTNRREIFLSNLTTRFFLPKEEQTYFVSMPPDEEEIYTRNRSKDDDLHAISALPPEVEKLKNLFFDILSEDMIFVEGHGSKLKTETV